MHYWSFKYFVDILQREKIIPPGNRHSRIYHNVPRRMDYPKERLHFIREIGEGSFGKVFLAEADGIVEEELTTLVAVKTSVGKGSSQFNSIQFNFICFYLSHNTKNISNENIVCKHDKYERCGCHQKRIACN